MTLGYPFVLPGARLDWRCASCGYRKGSHRHIGGNCPFDGRAFAQYNMNSTYLPVERGPMKKFDCTVENVAVSGVASELANGDYWATVSISGGLTYGFVMLRHGNTKTPKYKCTQAVRVTPGQYKIMKRETPVDILGLVLPVEKLFEHVVKTLVEFSDDSRTKDKA